MSEDSEFITLKEAAREVRLSVSTLKRYIYAGKLRSYRTPGGRHRLTRRDLAALLGAPSGDPGGGSASLARFDHFAEEVAGRIERALQRRLGFLESEVERLECSLETITAALRRAALPAEGRREEAPALPAGPDIRVLGPGCRACDQLARLVVEIVRAIGLQAEAVRRVREIEEIAEYGPTPMPALVVNNELVSAGRLPTKSRLTEVLRRYRPEDPHAERH